MAKYPEASLISLGIGDTTLPLAAHIVEAIKEAAMRLGTTEGYSGYGPEQGHSMLRRRIAEHFYKGTLSPQEIFISDGAKCDIGRLQLLFGAAPRIAIQDPAYPVYVDGSLIQGVSSIHFLPCHPENQFFPELEHCPSIDLLYLCSPNNPTGAAATRPQLQHLVELAKRKKFIILFDAAYAVYIQDPTLPRSIFEIEGADEVAIEISSFSKIAGFTGVRLGWTVIPRALQFEGGFKVIQDWTRLTTTLFNGASNLAQQAGIAVLDPIGWTQVSHKL